MSGHQHATIGDTVYFWFAANDTSGSGGDGATPLFDVREAGAAASAIPLLSGTPTLLSHADYPAGCHEIAVAATVGNGFAADDTFAVFCTLLVDSQNPSGFVGSCTLTPLAKASELAAVDTVVDDIKVTTDKFVFTVANEVDCNVITKTGFSLAATGLDAIASTATGMVEIAKAVWDRVLTGATHNVADSAGRRMRNLQEFGTYENDSVWIDTIAGTAGTTDHESGTILNKVDSIADANTIGASLGISGRAIIPGSSITFAASQDNQNFWGDNWTLALGGQSVSATHIKGAEVSGICTGASRPEFHECQVGAVTVPACRFVGSNINGTVTLPAGNVDLRHSAGEASGILDFGTTVADTTVQWTDFSGEIIIDNLGQLGTDVLNIAGEGRLTLNASCVGGTLNLDGHITVTNNGSGITINEDNVTNTAGLILADTGELQTDWANGGRLDLLLDQVITDIAALNNISAADVNAQVADVINTDTLAELSAVPAANASMSAKLNWLFLLARNKGTQTSTTKTIYADDTTTAVATSAVSNDGTTFTRGEYS